MGEIQKKKSTGISQRTDGVPAALTRRERILEAARGTPLADLPQKDEDDMNPLKKAVLFCCSLHGFDPPEQIDWAPMETWLRTGAYRSYTLEDLREAVFQHVNGEIQEVPAYRGFNTHWLRQVLDNYAKNRGPVLQEEARKRLEQPRELTEKEKEENLRKFWHSLVQDFDQVAAGGRVRLPIPHKYDKLVDQGIMGEPTDEEKWDAMNKAEEEQKSTSNILRRVLKTYGGERKKQTQAKIILVERFFEHLAEQGRDLRDLVPEEYKPQPDHDK